MCRKFLSSCAILGFVAAFSSSAPAENQDAGAVLGGDGVLDTSATGYMRIGHFPDFDLKDDFTIEVRARFDRFDGPQEIISKNSAWDNDGFVFKWRDNRLQFIRGGPGGEITTEQGAFTVASVTIDGLMPARMYDLAVVKKNKSVTFYLDGLALGTRKIGSLVATASDMTVSTPWAAGHLSGQIDELRIWRSALSTQKIEANIKQRFRGNETNLLALFSFEDVGLGQTVKNISRPDHHGDLFGKAILIHPRIIPAAMPSKL